MEQIFPWFKFNKIVLKNTNIFLNLYDLYKQINITVIFKIIYFQSNLKQKVPPY